jgi:hypothetical protein
VDVTAPVTLPSAPLPLADWFVALRWLALVALLWLALVLRLALVRGVDRLPLALVRGVDRLPLALVLARLRFAVEPFARLLPDLAARLVLGFDALADRLLELAELLLLRLDWAMGPPVFTLGRPGARPAASAPRRCDR